MSLFKRKPKFKLIERKDPRQSKPTYIVFRYTGCGGKFGDWRQEYITQNYENAINVFNNFAIYNAPYSDTIIKEITE